MHLFCLTVVRNHFVSDGDDKESNSINITKFMKEELGLKATDTMVVKMDIEGSEWPILRRWLRDLEMDLVVDELFVEIQVQNPSLAATARVSEGPGYA